LQPDTDFIGVSNIQVCLGQLQMNTNAISGAGGQRSGLAYEIEPTFWTWNRVVQIWTC